MQTKQCFKCSQVKSIDEFYKHPQMSDGHVNKCKECNKKDVRKNREAKLEYYHLYEQKRCQDPKRKKQVKIICTKRNQKHPEKYKARYSLTNAVRDGRIKKEPCKFCGSKDKVQGHHEDYTKPLEVEWVCFKCHREKKHHQKVFTKG